MSTPPVTAAPKVPGDLVKIDIYDVDAGIKVAVRQPSLTDGDSGES
jgi:hypothetical protein